MASGSIDRDDLTIEKQDVTARAIRDRCEEYGVCVIDSYLDDAVIEIVREDLSYLFDNPTVPGVSVHTDEDYYRALNVDYDRVDRSKTPAIRSLVDAPEFEPAVREYYGQDDVRYPSNLFPARSFGTADSPDGVIEDGPPYALHYDKFNKFKFFFYLTDVTLDEGPTHFTPGLHREVRAKRQRELSAGTPIPHLENTIRNVDQEIVPIVGEPGTLLIFDTDTPHHAGGLTDGSSREILRIDSFSPTHSGKPTSLLGKVKDKVARSLA